MEGLEELEELEGLEELDRWATAPSVLGYSMPPFGLARTRDRKGGEVRPAE